MTGFDPRALLPADAGYDAAGRLRVGGCDLAQLARAVGTPAYVYAEADLRDRAGRFAQQVRAHGGPGAAAHFALKALPCRAALRLAGEAGLGWEASSGGELRLALDAGADPAQGIWTGADKDEQALAHAVGAGLGLLVLDSDDDLRRADAAARAAGVRQDVLLSLVPCADADGIRRDARTGQLDRKGGFALTGGAADRAVTLLGHAPGLRAVGAHLHLGARLYDHVGAALRQAAAFLARTSVAAEVLDVGGGPNAPVSRTSPSAPTLEAHIARRVHQARDALARAGLPAARLVFEPGRSLTGPAGLTLYRVRAVKPGVRTYVVVDGGLHENARPLLYGTAQEVLPVQASSAAPALVSIAGMTAEAGDVLAWDVQLPLPRVGDLLAIPATGAYVHAMAGNWNLQPRPPVVFCAHGRHRVVVRRETHAEVIARDLG